MIETNIDCPCEYDINTLPDLKEMGRWAIERICNVVCLEQTDNRSYTIRIMYQKLTLTPYQKNSIRLDRADAQADPELYHNCECTDFA